METGQYLEQVFPLFGVRFIAINDNYDSLNSQSRDGMLVPIKSMINEMYSKDLSQNPNIFKGRIFCKKCSEKLVCHWQSDGSLYFYCKICHVSISEKDLWNGINKELHQRMEEHRDLQKLVRKSSGKSKLQSKEIATKREIEQASGNIVRLESQKRSGYEQYVLGKLSKEKFLELKQNLENEIV